MSDPNILTGTADAPLVATRTYTFHLGGVAEGRPTLWTPFQQRGPFDDHGVAVYAEQSAFVARALTGRAVVQTSSTAWTFRDAASLASLVDALRLILRPAAVTGPTATARRDVSTADARSCSGQAIPRLLDLVAAVSGEPSTGFRCLENVVDDNGWEPRRREVWQRDAVIVRLDAEGIASGQGVHGERASITVEGLADGIVVSAYIDIDMRSGGCDSRNGRRCLRRSAPRGPIHRVVRADRRLPVRPPPRPVHARRGTVDASPEVVVKPWLLLAPVLVLAACGGTKASCTICEVSFSDAECQQLAEQNGCTTGVAYQDAQCAPPTQGCQFDGCGVGPVTCDIGSNDTDM